MSAARRYNHLAPVYDIGIAGDRFYRAARLAAIERLDLFPGARVMVLFCGTGLDFQPMRERIGSAGEIFAVDGSAGMLKRARRRCRKAAAPEARTQFLQADFSKPAEVGFLCEAIHGLKPDRLFISMGLNCVVGWRAFAAAVLAALEPAAKVAMFDLYAEKRSVRSAFLNGVGAGDCGQKVWQALEKSTEDFDLCWLPLDRWLGVSLFAAVGTIPAGVSKA